MGRGADVGPPRWGLRGLAAFPVASGAAFIVIPGAAFAVVSGVVTLWSSPEFLLLFRCQYLTDLVHHRDMRQLEIDLFGGDGLEGWLHLAQIHGVRMQELLEIKPHRVDIGLETNDLFGMGAQQSLYRALLAVAEPKRLETTLHVFFETPEAVVFMLW